MTPLEQRIAKRVDTIPIPEIAKAFGITIQEDVNMVCPLPGHIHTNNTPSFRFYARTNTFNCFGSCHAAGGAFNFLRALLKNDEKEALDYAKAKLGVKVGSLAASFVKLAKECQEDKAVEEEISADFKLFKEQDRVSSFELYCSSASLYQMCQYLEIAGTDVSKFKQQLLLKLIEKNTADNV